MAAYRRVYDSRHLQADCQEPGSAPEPFARQSSVGYLYLFTLVSQYQKGKTKLDFTGARDSEWQWQWHQLGRMQVCTSLQTDNHATLHHSVFYSPDALPAAQPTASKH